MNAIFDMDADIGFGGADAVLPDWRLAPDSIDSDDAETDTTDADVIAMLGFDPKDPKAKT